MEFHPKKIKNKQWGITAWIISVSSGSGSGLMFKSSSSKRTAIRVISISSSEETEFQNHLTVVLFLNHFIYNIQKLNKKKYV